MAHKTTRKAVRATPKGAGTKVHGKSMAKPKSVKSGTKPMDPSVTTRMFT